MLRLVIDSLVALMVAGVLVGIFYYYREDGKQAVAIEQTKQALHEVQQQLALQAALEKVELNPYGHPRTIDPEWFNVSLPINELLTDSRPWLEIAGPEDRASMHPGSIIASNNLLATFWYNPYKGVVRARVPSGISDAQALELYNSVNSTQLQSTMRGMTNR